MFFPANGRQKKAAFGTDTQLFPRGGKEFGGEEQSGGSEGSEDTDVESDAAHVTSMLAQPQPTHAMRSREHAERRHHRRRPSPSTQIVPKKLLDCPIQIISKTAPRCFFVEMKTPTTGQATKKKRFFLFSRQCRAKLVSGPLGEISFLAGEFLFSSSIYTGRPSPPPGDIECVPRRRPAVAHAASSERNS